MNNATNTKQRPLELEWDLRLFVARQGPATDRAVEILQEICRSHLAGNFQLELIDIEMQPDQADEFDIIATPTLVRVKPRPERRIVGDFSRSDEVRSGLELPPVHGA